MQPDGKILIVDDSLTNVALLEDILGDDYQVRTATSGEQALAAALDFDPGLILLDIMMPGIDGYETCRRIRETPALSQAKIIMVSAKALVDERLRGYEAGADDYIIKPYDEEELLAKVRVYLRLRSVEEVSQLKSDILSLLRHEARTPLNGILAPVQMLREDQEMGAAERAELLDLVQQSARNLHRFFERVAMLSEMKAGEWHFRFVPYDLCQIVQSAVREAASQASTRRITVEQRLPETARALLDLESMPEVIAGLIDNAIRFSRSEGRVVAAVSREGDRWCLTVTDQGEAIDPDLLPHLFDGLTTANLANHTEGHGLSLALACQVVLAHDGTIGVESTAEGETTFTVRLPVAPPANGDTRRPFNDTL